MNRLVEDLRLTLRSLRRAPAFTVTTVLILGLGIGMSAAMFSTFNAITLRRLPVAEQERLILPKTLTQGVDFGLSPREIDNLQQASRTMTEVAGVWHGGTAGFAITDGDRWLWLNQAVVTGKFFQVLGARPAAGRLLLPADDVVGGERVIVLSHDVWKMQFGGDSAVVGHQLVQPLTRWRYRIVGVAPMGLGFPVGADFWISNQGADTLNDWNAVARLAPGADLNAAREEFWSIMQLIDRDRTWRQNTTVPPLDGAAVTPFADAVVGEVRPALRLLMAGVVLLLLIACINVGNLLLLRVSKFTHEVAIRRTLGAGVTDIVRFQLLETAVLVLGGGALGGVCAWTFIQTLVRLAPPGFPQMDLIRETGAPVGAAVGATLLVLILVSVIPLIAVGHSDLLVHLRPDARSGRQTMGRRRVRHWLVGSQLSLAVVTMAFAGLLVRSLERLQRLDLGYAIDNLSFLSIVLPVTQENADDKLAALYEAGIPRLRAVPGVDAVTPIGWPPFTGPQVMSGRFEAEGQSQNTIDASPPIPMEIGGPDYFRTLQIPILGGRGFLDADRDKAPPVAVVSETVAKLFWPGENPVGRRLRQAGDTGAGAWRTVVGVAGDIRIRSLRDTPRSIYLPWRQTWAGLRLIAVRTSDTAGDLLPSIRRALHDVDPQADIARVQTMREYVSAQHALPEISTLLLAAFGAIALLLAVVGLYGAMASSVGERTREIGIRAALGATPARLRRDVLNQAMTVAGMGAFVGLAAALGSARLVHSLLFEVSPTDPLTLATVSLLLLVVAAAAAYLPARRATRIDPAQALRSE
jgi:putative ABC transport system permease protein